MLHFDWNASVLDAISANHSTFLRLTEESGEDAQGIELFLPAPSEIFWSFIVILVIAIAFYKFILPKMNATLEGRSEQIEGEIAKASQMKHEAQQLHDQYTEEMKNKKLEAAAILDSARSEGNAIIHEAHIKASDEATQMIRNASRQIDSERKAAETALKKQVGSLSMAMTQKMLQQGVDNEDRQCKLVDSAIDRFEASVKGLPVASIKRVNNEQAKSHAEHHPRGYKAKGSATSRRRRTVVDKNDSKNASKKD